ncbi:HNH endonuclease [Corynebacterium cystitidis]|uniref:HNH endonuclease n=2 Tax=Corynebacterium cystitidis TaxID=35757 RepID=UPI00211E3228|nr:HNH endonuclease [Corynebacterium cystitidis]
MGRHVPTYVRKRILERDNFMCQSCFAKGVPLEIDHIDNSRGPGYDLDANLRVLCVECHGRKTRDEQAYGIAQRVARRRLPQQSHPGRL